MMKPVIVKRLVNTACAVSAWYIGCYSLTTVYHIVHELPFWAFDLIWKLTYCASPVALLLALCAFPALWLCGEHWFRKILRALLLIVGALLIAYTILAWWVMHHMDACGLES